MAKNDTIFKKPVDNSVETVEYFGEKQGITGLSRWITIFHLWITLWKLWRKHIAKCNKKKSVKLHNIKKISGRPQP
ncbi:MAG: hypothetical protein IJX59_08695, partial [Clostridia bacterium]|nr:hypothetical protein [Clostridia bacterium]